MDKNLISAKGAKALAEAYVDDVFLRSVQKDLRSISRMIESAASNGKLSIVVNFEPKWYKPDW